ncbi:NADH-ubiquinone oxidoreductase 213 kda subunit [Moesziomyces antarcticus]|uniref:NADH-ubiquinone oxidoreductase 213 kDa subunit n=2 Tax=Pseudozyma antarctica TaxID=84753 RepID=A0A081CGR0_PSEA2|nr:NADH-ubiquinone oxidoreductase 213 kda subunit [Moesziomyces antarcticus]GAK65856.1 NADH-ubiquinone oxidoreductase 213 kda subunit [Moesziomyces antarcticus]SPO45485.1 related to nadh-ubiquinone oxidoreductase 21.3 kda subunit [Moesziomyces antarcticus]
MANKTNEQVVTETYSERSAIADGMTSGAASAGAGLLVSAIQNSVQTHNKGALGVFTRTGSTIALFTAMGGIFSYTDATVANFRQKDDAINGAIGGCAAGVVLGAAARSVPMMFGGCASLAALIGTFDAAGKSLSGVYARPSPNDFTHSDHDASHGTHELSWKEAREARRQSFFKQKKEDVESDA